MTFRTRLVLATAVVVAIAVILASSGAWVVARNALIQSTDDTLAEAAQTVLNRPYIDANDSPGAALQVVDAQGAVVVPSLAGRLPVDHGVLPGQDELAARPGAADRLHARSPVSTCRAAPGESLASM